MMSNQQAGLTSDEVSLWLDEVRHELCYYLWLCTLEILWHFRGLERIDG